MKKKTTVSYNETKYTSSGFRSGISASPRDDPSVIQYIKPRLLVPPNASNCCPSSGRGMAWSKVGASLPNAKTTDHGLATLVQPAKLSANPLIHSIDGKRIVDEQRELSKLSDKLCATILKCSGLEVHNHALELQRQWLEKHINKNCLVIRRMFEAQTEATERLLNENSRPIPALQAKMDGVKDSQSLYDQQYQQLISRRNGMSKEIFDDERRIAQTDAESQFLRRRLRNLEDESKFYLLKNQALQERKARLQCQFDEENFARQTLQGELRILQNEKITNEDLRAAAMDNARKGIDITQVAGLPSSKHYTDQLKQEVQRMRDEYAKKIEVYREELHRKFELHACRYKMQNIQPESLITREHEEQLEEHIGARKEVLRQITALRAQIDEVKQQIETLQRRVNCDGNDFSSRMERQRRLTVFHQSLRERERQLEEALRARRALEQKIQNYKERMDYHSKHPTPCVCDKRATIHGIDCSSRSASAPARDPSYRSSWSQGSYRLDYQDDSTSGVPPSRRTRPSSPGQSYNPSYAKPLGSSYEDGLNQKQPSHDAEQDCRVLHRLLNDSAIDEIGIIRILCNRTVGQRLQIRNVYEQLFNRMLADDLEKISSGSLSKFLRMLLLSSVECDCFELRRTLQRSTINKNVLVEILFGRSNDHIQAVRSAYRRLFKRTIEQDIEGDQDSKSKRVFISVLEAKRPEENEVNDNDIDRDARDLFETEAEWRKNGSTFLRLLCTRSNAHLKLTFAAYQQYSNVDIEQTIRMHIEGELYRALIAIIRIIRNPAAFFANALHKCLRGNATNEEDLNRIIVTRHEADMAQIKIEYLAIAKYTLYEHIQANVMGNYRRALLELVRESNQPNAREATLRPPCRSAETTRHPTSEGRVQFRESGGRLSPDYYNGRSVMRSISDRALNETKRNGGSQPLIDSVSAGSSPTITARLMRADEGQFMQMSKTTAYPLPSWTNGD